jgi:hypothetical protein
VWFLRATAAVASLAPTSRGALADALGSTCPVQYIPHIIDRRALLGLGNGGGGDHDDDDG